MQSTTDRLSQISYEHKRVSGLAKVNYNLTSLFVQWLSVPCGILLIIINNPV